MSSHADTWRLAPDTGEARRFENMVEFALGVYGQLANIQRDIGALTSSQQAIVDRMDAFDGRSETRTESRVAQVMQEFDARAEARAREFEAQLKTSAKESELRLQAQARQWELDRKESQAQWQAYARESEARWNSRFNRIESKLDNFEARTEARFQNIEIRFDGIETQVDKMEARIESNGNLIASLRDRVNRALWVTTGGGIVLGLAFGWKPVIERLSGLLGV